MNELLLNLFGFAPNTFGTWCVMIAVIVGCVAGIIGGIVAIIAWCSLIGSVLG